MDLLPKDYKITQSVRGIKINELNVDNDPLKKWVIFVVILFIISGIVAGSIYFYQIFLLGKIDNIKKEISNLEKQKNIALIDKLLTLEKKIINLKNLVKNHTYSSNVISLLESSIIAPVQLSGLSLDTTNATLILDGYSSDWFNVAKQIAFFEQQGWRIMSVSKLATEREKGIAFSIKVGFNTKLLKK